MERQVIMWHLCTVTDWLLPWRKCVNPEAGGFVWGKNGQARVKAYYRQERMIRLYRELYEEVIQKNGWNRI